MPINQVSQQLSNEVYKLKNSNSPVILGNVTGVDGSVWELRTIYSSNASAHYKDSAYDSVTKQNTTDGYAGAVYINDTTKEVVIVNAGTKGALDLVNDAQMAMGMKPMQYNEAMEIANEAVNLAKSLGYSVSATGHSL